MLNLLVENKMKVELTLYKNSREPIGEIDKSWINSDFKCSLENIDEFELKIPKFITIRNEKKINSIYLKIRPKMQIIMKMTIGENIKYRRFTLEKKGAKSSKWNGDKTYTAYSYEYTIRCGRPCNIKGIYHMKNDATYQGQAILDDFIKANPNWTIDYIDPLACTEVSEGMEMVNVIVSENFINNKITNGGLIWEKDIATNVPDGTPLYCNIQHNKVNTFNNKGEKILENDDLYNAIEEPLSGNITKIQAYHYKGADYQWGIKYVFTLQNGNKEIRICNFTNIIDKKMTCESITFNYETGRKISNRNVKYINVDKEGINWYEFLRDIQDQFNAIFIFDDYKKTISVYSRETLGELSPLELSFDSGIIDIETTEKSKYPCGLMVKGKDNLSIATENIFGGEVIYDYSWYKKNIMSEDLVSKWERYENHIKVKHVEYETAKDNYMKAFQRVTSITCEMKTLETKLKALKDVLASEINANSNKAGGNFISEQSETKHKIDEVEKQIAEDTQKLSNYAQLVQTYEDDMAKIALQLDKKNATDSIGKIFNENDLQELYDMECIEEYSDDYYTTPLGLYNNAKAILADKIKPQIDFKIKCANFIKLIQNPAGWDKVLKFGNWFKFNIDDDILEELGEDTVRLSDCTIDIKKENACINDLVFTNKTKKIDKTKFASNIGKTANTAVKTSNKFGSIYNDAINTINVSRQLRVGMLDMAATSARSRTSSNIIDMGSYGLFLYDAEDQKRAIFINNGLICLTLDGFETCRTAISPDGITAQELVGKEILGEKLLISNEKNQFVIDGSGLKIYDGIAGVDKLRVFLGVEEVDGVTKARLRLRGKNGELCISEDGIIMFSQYNDRDEVDESHPMRIPFTAMEGTVEFKKVLLNIYFDKFRATARSASATLISEGSTTDGGGGVYKSTSTESGGSYSSSLTTDVATSGEVVFDVNGETGSGHDEHGGVDGATVSNHFHTFSKNIKIEAKELSHQHNVNISIPSHHHDYTLSIADHSHSFKINNTHNHKLEYGIYEDSEPSNVAVYVNDELVVDGIMSSSTIDITSHIKINQVNMIKITSDSKGRIISNIACKSMQQW